MDTHGYNVINSAVSGFLSGQELAQMIHYFDDFVPELYIVLDGWNDVSIPYESIKEWPVLNPFIGYNNAFLMIENRLADYVQLTRIESNLQAIMVVPIGELLDENEFSNVILEHTQQILAKCMILPILVEPNFYSFSNQN